MPTTRELCFELADDVIKNIESREEPLKTIYRTINGVINDHYDIEYVLEEIGYLNADQYKSIIKIMFKTKKHWGYIVVAYALLKYLKNPDVDGDECKLFITDFLYNWIKDNGGWGECVSFFQKEKEIRAKQYLRSCLPSSWVLYAIGFVTSIMSIAYIVKTINS